MTTFLVILILGVPSVGALLFPFIEDYYCNKRAKVYQNMSEYKIKV